MPDRGARSVTTQVSHHATVWAQVSFLRSRLTSLWHMGPRSPWRKPCQAVANRIHPRVHGHFAAGGRRAGGPKGRGHVYGHVHVHVHVHVSRGAMVQLPENCTPLSMNTSGAWSVPE